MLQSLSVRNFILIDELEIEFEKGLCVITGETGAGKSILLDAILFSLGNKFSDNIIKDGYDFCSVTATFTLNDHLKELLDQFNIEHDGELFIKRTQKLGTRKKFLINDQVVTQNSVQQIANYLFELHGQNNHTSLLSPSSHLNILDDYGDLLGLRMELAKCYNVLQENIKEASKINQEKENIYKEIDYLTFIIEELTNLNILEGEEEKLINIRHTLQNREKELVTTQTILGYLENPELINLINNARRLISRNLLQDETLASISANLEDCYNSLEEAQIKLQNIINKFEENEFNLDEIEERLFLLRAKARKYNISCESIPQFVESSKQQLTTLQNKIKNVENLAINTIEKYKEYLELANLLSNKRSISARKLETAIQKELTQLKMEKAIFKIEINRKDILCLKEGAQQIQPELLNIYNNGIDEVRFTASTNPGMKLAPIDKIASGGELSRFMLAIKTCLFDKLLIDTIIFDEIDTGIGGVVADKIGERLKKLSLRSQVIVITHQPQVAGKADQHILVTKTQYNQHTKISIKNLDNLEKEYEIARMLSGKLITDITLKAAKELLIN
ncbi:DNA repair protein RecN [Candidatus Tisiphia endosymbiont of Beris chalybata]|uniref:DNA repair protein RecN n=1 Tax=Candidatus Tisiphia endosymbiont of Beris chalybata TaxID=3066262 RepID=UPI00312CB246